MRSAIFPPVRVEPEVRAEVEAVLREGASLTQFIEEAVADLWRLGELAIARALAGEAPTELVRNGH